MEQERMCVVAEQELHAFVDGRLDRAASARIAARLVNDPAAIARIRAYESQNAGLLALYGPVAAEPVPARLAAVIAKAAGNGAERVDPLAPPPDVTRSRAAPPGCTAPECRPRDAAARAPGPYRRRSAAATPPDRATGESARSRPVRP